MRSVTRGRFHALTVAREWRFTSSARAVLVATSMAVAALAGCSEPATAAEDSVATESADTPQSRIIELTGCPDLEAVASALAEAGLADSDASRRRMQDTRFAATLGVDAGSLEGYLPPGAHSFPLGTSVDDILTHLVALQKRTLEEVFGNSRTSNLEAHGALVLASIVAKESERPGEYEELAALYRNRLAAGWSLESPSHARATNGDGFDTFAEPGLPGAPICSPPADALRAVVSEPVHSHSFLFRDPDGQLRFELQPSVRRALEAVPADPAPEELTRGNHYFVSNEWRQHHFREPIAHKEGVMIGVGADQNYLFAGWARPEILVLMDFDAWIVDLHRVYRVAFLSAPNHRAFVRLWKHRKRFRRMIAAEYRDDRRMLRGTLRVFDRARWTVHQRLDELAQRHKRSGRTSFLTDEQQYQFIVALFRADRVVAVRGDLTADLTMRRLGGTLDELGYPVRILYLSNAEQYFKYGKSFRANILGLPVDEQSYVLRTRPTGQDYTYVLQTFANFRRWLETPYVRSVDELAPREALAVRRPLLVVDKEPPPAQHAREPQ